MKLRPSQRSRVAECICRVWLKRRGIRLRVPPIYVIRHSKGGTNVWGRCKYSYRGTGAITLHLGVNSVRRDWYILLAHEFAHWVDKHTVAPKYRPTGHGETFQRILWGLVPRTLWKRASRDQWIGTSSAHKPQFQPI